MPASMTRLLATSALCAMTSTASAQQADGPVLLDRIIFGFGTPRVALDTPQAVTSLDQDDIDRQQATTPAELLDDVPGVQPIGSNRAAGISFNIRGIGELAASDESKIVVTVDGATKFHEQYRVGSFFGDPELYKRVEVLRGPASSTLVGAGALGGAIAFETKDPADFLTDETDNALRFRLGLSSNGEGGFGSVIYATRPNDRAEFLANLTYRNVDDYDDGDGNAIEGSEFDSLSGILKGVFHFDAGQSLELSYSAFDSDLDDTAYSQTGTLGFGTIDRRVTDQTLTLNYANTAPGNALLDLEATLFVSDTSVEQENATAPIPSPLFLDTDYGYETVGLRVQNTARYAFAQTALTTGLQISRQERTAETSQGGLEFHPEGTDQRIGVYAQAEMTFGRLTLTPGLRVDHFDLEPDDRIPGGRDVSNTAVSPKIAAFYEIDPSWAVFGSLSRTERSPTLDELYSSDSRDGETAALFLEPERADAVELGVSYQADNLLTAGDRVGVKATAFRYEIDDLIERDNRANTPFYRQIGEARLEGLEIEGAWDADRLFGRLAYTYVDGEDKTTGEPLVSIPAENLTLTLGGRNTGQTLQYGWTGTFIDDITEPGDERSPGYAVHDLFAVYTPDGGSFDGWQVRAGIDNVLDKDFRNNLAGDDGPGRTFKLTFTRAIDW